MENKVLKAIEDFALIKAGQRVTVALSGGADSMALLNALISLKESLGIELSAAHFNHKIRDDEAERDQNFVQKQCNELGIRLFIGASDVPKIAKEKGISLELAAREERYKFLECLDTDIIATAHTASDNIETVLFNITRGTTTKGLCGIPVVRGKFIRPIILCTRSDVEDYCQEKGIDFVTDSTNLCDDYSRNKIRHNVVPILKEINPSLEETAIRSAISLREDNDFLEQITILEFSKRFEKNTVRLDDFNNLHRAIAKRVIAKYYQIILGESADNFHINKIYNICLNGGRTSLIKRNYAVAEENHLIIRDTATDLSPKYDYFVKIEEKNINDFKNIHDLLLNNMIDCDKIVGKLLERSRMSGDKVHFRNSNGTKTLKKLYTERAVPLSERTVLPVLADDEGVVWVFGMNVAKRCAVTKETKKVFCIDAERKKLGD